MTSERFIELVKSEQEPLRRFLLGLCCGDGATADDLAQDALVRAYVASGSFLGLAKFRTWLFRIAYNCFIDYTRRRRDTLSAMETGPEVRVAADDSADSSFRYQQLYMALDRLPEKERAAIVLFYFEDRSIKEISSIMDMPAGTVKYQLSVGRNHLREYIKL